jgi:Tfp pilus assembly protein PilV
MKIFIIPTMSLEEGHLVSPGTRFAIGGDLMNAVQHTIRTGTARRRRRHRTHESGMAMFEVALAMGVLVIASLTVATSTTSSFHATNQSESTIRVENAIRETMESLRAVDFEDLDALDGNQLYTDDKLKNILIAIRVTQVSPTLKAIEIDVFRKVRTGPSTVRRGDAIFHALTYRSLR